MSNYDQREHTWAKHWLLRHYLQKLAYKVGPAWQALNYVDGFAGPWRSEAEDLSDTSPHIAVKEFRDARVGIGMSGRPCPRVRCLFIEQNHTAYERLRESFEAVADIEVRVLQGTFEDVIPSVLEFCAGAFTFFFIDPTGWTGYGLKAITPILRHTPCEVLINFMTADIIRFIDDENSTALPTFVDLFGQTDYREKWKGLRGLDREDAIVAAYCDRVKEVGGFAYVVAAPILHRVKNQVRYHLVYATRSIQGLRVFREAEQSAMKTAKAARTSTRSAKHVELTGQPHLLLDIDDDASRDPFCHEMKARYDAVAKGEVLGQLTAAGEVRFDDLVAMALSHQMVCEKDLKDWVREWVQRGHVRLEGLGPRERVFKVGMGHQVAWLEGDQQ